MAHVYRHEPSGVFRTFFRFGGQQFHKSLKTTDPKQANAWLGRIEATIHDLDRGRLTLPDGADVWEFIKSDGTRSERLQAPKGTTLEGLFDWYFGSLPEGSKESNTAKTERIHANHLKRLLGAGTKLDSITGQDLQEQYVNQRAKAKWRGKPIRPQTIRKEVASLRMVWNQAFQQGVVKSKPPTKGLRYPKGSDKPAFQTWAEIERTIRQGKLTDAEQRELWGSLFLDTDQIAAVLRYVRDGEGRPSWFYPLMVFVAHTGARRSEAARARVEDFRFGDGVVHIRERKRDRTKETTRMVHMSPLLAETIRRYFETDHPGGRIAFCREADRPLTKDVLHDTFKAALRSGKWKVIRGYHCFRHSFASNLARMGEDQRAIDTMMGHHTEDMRRRYRHLFPEQRENAITRLFS